jgi:hypothetical protein
MRTKNQQKLLLVNYCNSCAKQADEEEDDFLTTQLFGRVRSCLLARSTTVVIFTWQHPKKV